MIRNISVILLYDDNKRILLQHRDNKAKSIPLYWAFFGGGIDKGETPEEALKRETKEELDYEVKSPKLIMKQNFQGDLYHGIKHVFMEKYDNTQKLTLLEGQDWGWFEPSKTLKLKMTEHDREVLRKIEDKY